MIETFFHYFWFTGALSISLISFVLGIFWVASVAGIADGSNGPYKSQ
jgi:hypothetical protein